jgi:hypothetical protein
MLRPRILISGLNGWSLRNTCYSGLLHELARKANVYVLVRRGAYSDLGEFAKAIPEVELIETDGPRVDPDMLENIGRPYFQLLQYYFVRHLRRNDDTFRIKVQHGYLNRVPRTLLGRAMGAASIACHRLGLQSWLIDSLDANLARHPISESWRRVFQNHEFDAVFLPSYLFSEDKLLASNARYHRRQISVGVLSWDNLSTKSALTGVYSRYLVWSNNMRDELLGYYQNIDPQTVCVTGPLQFDWHKQDRWVVPREEFCRAKGLDSNRPYIFYGTSAPRQAPGEQLVIEALAEACRTGPLRHISPQIYLRLHPKDDGSRYSKLKASYPNLVWDQPNGADGDVLRWLASADDIQNLVNSIRHAAVVVNIFSTITLDALVLDRPVINVSWSPGSEKPWPGTLGKLYTHFKPVIDGGASPVVGGLDELNRCIQNYVGDETLHRDQRESVSRTLCGPCDGLSHKRIAACLLEQV